MSAQMVIGRIELTDEDDQTGRLVLPAAIPRPLVLSTVGSNNAGIHFLRSECSNGGN
jgi:hypothetical protein